MAPSSSASSPGALRREYRLGEATITLTLDAGPRVAAYTLAGHRNLFADLPDEVIEHPATGTFRFIGGHRLWRAPEQPSVTYQPDDGEVAIVHGDDTLTVTGPPDSDGIVRTIALAQEGRHTIVDHRFENTGSMAVETALWAISQLTTGGHAILPAPTEIVDEDGLLPNRALVLWPYSDPGAAGVLIRRDAVRIDAGAIGEKFKVGQPNRRGWVAYAWEDELFVKWSPLHDDASTYVDMGASVQCYLDPRFVELESQGPLISLGPGERCGHREVWTMIHATGHDVDLMASLPSIPVT